MKIKKRITLTTHISQQRKAGPLSKDEVKQLTDFFIALMDLDITYQDNVKKIWRSDDQNK